MNKTDNNTTPNIPEEWYTEAKTDVLLDELNTLSKQLIKQCNQR